MPRYNAEQIYAVAREAGFSPDEATTMTAIAMAESGGDSRSHNSTGEDSRGLWQINAAVHPDLAAKYDLWDPAQNALAARAISHNGTDVSPWTVTHHGHAARYLRFQTDAQAAAVAYGDGPGLGVWTGTPGYGHSLSAGDHDTTTAPHVTEVTDVDGGAHPAYEIPLDALAGTPATADYGIPLVETTPVATTTMPADDTKLDTFLRVALAQAGDTYIYGYETKLNDPNPHAFDCSELVQWSAHQADVNVDDGAVYQYRQMQHAGTTMSVEEALHTRGALLFYFDSDPKSTLPDKAHVAISLGDGRTIEARNPRKGVNIFTADNKRFNYAAYIPGLSAPAATTGAAGGTSTVADQLAVDTTALATAASAPADQLGIPTTDVVAGAEQTSIVTTVPGTETTTVPAGSTTGGNTKTDDTTVDTFERRIGFDPDTLDTAAGAGADDTLDVDATHTTDDDPAAHTSGDVDHDGYDDALAAAIGGHPPPGVHHDDDTTHHDGDGHDTTAGH